MLTEVNVFQRHFETNEWEHKGAIVVNRDYVITIGDSMSATGEIFRVQMHDGVSFWTDKAGRQRLLGGDDERNEAGTGDREEEDQAS